jgi:hypothetical protein
MKLVNILGTTQARAPPLGGRDYITATSRVPRCDSTAREPADEISELAQGLLKPVPIPLAGD